MSPSRRAKRRRVAMRLLAGLAAGGLVIGGYLFGRLESGGPLSVSAPEASGGETAEAAAPPAPPVDRLASASAGADPSGADPSGADPSEADLSAAGAPDAVSGLRSDAAPVQRDGGGPRLAIVIDDLGRSVEAVEELRGLGVHLSYSVLPFESRTPQVVAALAEGGEETLCHLPMEARDGEDPGPGALYVDMRPKEIRKRTRRALEAVPGAIGVNNHMGSAFSENRGAMTAVLEELAGRDLYYLDSRTSAASVGYALAREMGLVAAKRRVFLDRDRDPAAISAEFRRLLQVADEDGAGVAIGHPFRETLEVLRREVPRALAEGYRFVRVSEVASRAPALP